MIQSGGGPRLSAAVCSLESDWVDFFLLVPSGLLVSVKISRGDVYFPASSRKQQ